MDCPTIHGLKLDSSSREAIEQIRSKAELSRLLGGTLSIGVLSNIFTRSTPIEASYNIYSTDFVTFAKALQGINNMRRSVVEKIALRQHLRAPDYQQRQFWKAVYEGCKL